MTLDPGQLEPQTAPAETPARSDAEIQRLVEETAQRLVDARIPGLQAVYEKQIAGLRKELKAAKSDPEGYAADSSHELQAELQAAQRKIAAFEVGRQYPDAFPVYQALIDADTPEAQLELLQSIVRPQAQPAPAPVPEPAPQEQVGLPVDLNRPHEGGPRGTPDAMDASTASSILDAFTSWPKFR